MTTSCRLSPSSSTVFPRKPSLTSKRSIAGNPSIRCRGGEMLILVHEPQTLFHGSRGRLVNTEAIRDIKPINLGNYTPGSCSLITFRDGTTLKVTDSLGEFLEAEL